MEPEIFLSFNHQYAVTPHDTYFFAELPDWSGLFAWNLPFIPAFDQKRKEVCPSLLSFFALWDVAVSLQLSPVFDRDHPTDATVAQCISPTGLPDWTLFFFVCPI